MADSAFERHDLTRSVRTENTLSGVGGSGRRPLECTTFENRAGARVRATGVAFLCMGARDPGLRVILEALGGFRDSQEAPRTLQRAPDGSPDAIRGSEKLV